MKKFVLTAALAGASLCVAACDPATSTQEPTDEVIPDPVDDTETRVTVKFKQELTEAQISEFADRAAEADPKTGEPPIVARVIVYDQYGGRPDLNMRMVELMVRAGLAEVTGCWNFSHPLCP